MKALCDVSQIQGLGLIVGSVVSMILALVAMICDVAKQL